MNTAFWRILGADLKSHKAQFLMIWAVLTLSAMLLTVSLLVMGSTDEPWDRTFEATQGPHVWVVSRKHDTDFSSVLQDPAISARTEVIYSLADNPLVLNTEKIPVFLYALAENTPVARPLLAEGRWVTPSDSGEIVLDFSLARYYDFQVGDEVAFLTPQGTQALTVVGLAVTAHWFPYDDITKDVAPGVGYLSDSSLQRLQPDPEHWYAVVGLRLHDPEASKEFVEKTYELLASELQTVIDWQFVKANAALSNTINASFMGVLSGLGLVVVGLIIFNTIGGQILSKYRDLGLYKAIGFKPSQLTALFLAEHLVVGLGAVLPGIVLGLILAPGLISPLAENLNTMPPEILTPGPLLAVLLLIETAVALATLLPAWRGGRISTVRAITQGSRARPHRVSRLAQFASWLGLSPVVVLGVKDTFTRPLRAGIALTGLVLTVLAAITSVAVQDAANELSLNRVYFNGTSADLTVKRNFVSPSFIQELILSRPEIHQHYAELPAWGQVTGRSDQPVFFRFLSEGYADFDFQVKEGRMIAEPGEAVMGYAVLELLGAQVGDTVEITVQGEPVELTIVGRHAEFFNSSKVVLSSLETYHRQFDPTAEPQVYYLRLKDPAAASDLRSAWLGASHGWINVDLITEEPQASMVQLRNVIVGFGAILMFVTVGNLMSLSWLNIRERVRDFGIQKALGLTPRQIAQSVVVGSIVIALLALVLGTLLGLGLLPFFFEVVWVEIGAGPDLYRMGWEVFFPLLPLILTLAVLSSLLPSRRAARLEVTQALRHE